MSDAHALFTTKASTGLVMDGILFNKAFAEANPEVVNKFIQGSLQAAGVYETEMETIKSVMPMFSTATDEEIVDNCGGAKLATWKDNSDLLNGNAKTIYTDMCDVWASIGESSEKDIVDAIFDDTYIKNLEGQFSSDETSMTETVKVTEDNEDEIIDAEAMLSKSVTVNFIKSTAKFSDTKEAKAALDEFIKIANILDGAIIQVEGNTDPNPNSDPEDKYNKKLSKYRADAVKKYLVMNGIDADRIVTVGNGSSKPVVKNDTEEHRAMNRRTDISFKMIEQ